MRFSTIFSLFTLYLVCIFSLPTPDPQGLGLKAFKAVGKGVVAAGRFKSTTSKPAVPGLTPKIHSDGTHHFGVGPVPGGKAPTSIADIAKTKIAADRFLANSKASSQAHRFSGHPVTASILHLPHDDVKFAASNIKGGKQGPSVHTDGIVTDACKHRNQGRCSEPAVIADAINAGHDVHGGVLTGTRPPCDKCVQTLKEHGVTSTTRRSMAELEFAA